MLEAHVFSVRRVWALVLRYFYLLRGSWGRMIDVVFWPTVQVLTWGLITQFFITHSTWVAEAGGVLLGAVMLWDILFRAQAGVTGTFMEELYARNLGQLFVSPLRPYEFAVALLVTSLIKTTLGLLLATVVASLLYGFGLFTLGMPLLVFFACLLMFGWAAGLVVCALLLRYGMGYEGLAWASVFVLAPLSGVYYPLSTLPDWAQTLGWLLPTSYVFEGMRTIMIKHSFAAELFINALLLNLGYFFVAIALFLYAFRVARVRGALLQVGE